MKKTLLLTLCTLALLFSAFFVACAADKNTVSSTGKTQTRTYLCKGFTAIYSDAPVTVHYTQDSKYAVRMTWDTDYSPEISVSGGTLRIDRKENNVNITSGRIDVYVTAPRIDRLELIADCDFETESIKGQTLTVTTRGSGDITAGTIACRQLDITARGSGNITAGTLACSQIDINALGSGDIKAETITGDKTTVTRNGSGNTRIGKATVTDLSISQTGSGDLAAGTLQCNDIQLSSLGSGNFAIKKSTSRTFDLRVNGSGDNDINADAETLTLSSTGSASNRITATAQTAELSLLGSGSLKLTYKGDDLTLNNNGSADTHAHIDTRHVSAHCNGPSTITLDGAAQKVDLAGFSTDNIDVTRLKRH